VHLLAKVERMRPAHRQNGQARAHPRAAWNWTPAQLTHSELRCPKPREREKVLELRRQAHVVEGVRYVDSGRPQHLARRQLDGAEAATGRQAGLVGLREPEVAAPAIDHQALATILLPNGE